MSLDGKKHSFYLSETTYACTMNTIVLPYLENHKSAGVFSHENRKLSYTSFLLDFFTANVVLLHGFAETKEKYNEVVYYFLKKKYQVFAFDQYGHGESKPDQENAGVVHIDKFDHYVEDTHVFIEKFVKKEAGDKPIVLYGHSMGGCIAALLAEKEPDLVDALILNAPMFSINTIVPETLGMRLSMLSIKLNLENESILGLKTLDSAQNMEYKPSKIATSSQIRGEYAFLDQLNRYEILTWMPSWNWLNESLKATEKVLQPANIKKITKPILMFQGENDWIVLPDGHKTFVQHARFIEFILIGDSGHEIYLEKDGIVWLYFDKIFSFIEKILKTT